MLQSHTATQQWQSFEMRMRRRRVERCLLRASVALEAGVVEDAREALAEAERLSPSDPEVQRLTAQLARSNRNPGAPVVPSASQPREFDVAEPVALRDISVPVVPAYLDEVPASRSRRVPLAAAALLIPLSAAAGWYWTREAIPPVAPAAVAAPPPAPATETSFPQSEAPSVTLSESSISVPAAASVEPERPSGPVATSGTESDTARPAPAAPVASTVNAGEMARRPRSETPRTSPVPAPPVSAGLTGAIGGATPAPVPTESKPATALPEPAAPVVSGAEGIAAPDSAVKLAPLPPAPPAPQATAQPAVTTPPPAATRADEQNIRAVLSRYEAAYSRLDAAAASAVWPGVNQRALANAFDGLSAQSISLGQCDVRVNGNTAHADCTGTARWTPKVGAGTQTAARRWRFDLRNASNGWVITQAVIR